MSNNLKYGVTLLVALVVVNILGSQFFERFDLTEDKRYTLSEQTTELIQDIEEPIVIRVYLEGDFPSEFKRLQTETQMHLEELKSENSKIKFRFIEPTDIAEELIQKGFEPNGLQVQENGKLSEIVIFPYAEIMYKGNSAPVSLLKDIYTNSQEQQLEGSIQNLEFAFASAIFELVNEKQKKVAVLKGNGELDDIYIADYLRALNKLYYLAPFTLDSVASNPTKTLNEIQNFDLLIVAKPTEKFTEEEKFVLDQYTMNGGKSLWLVDNVQAELDSLTISGSMLAYPRDLGLTDFFFNYGVRINPNLIQDVYSGQITLASGVLGNQTQFSQFPWPYFPLSISKNNHPINANTEAVVSKFTNSIDTLKNTVKKTVILSSSDASKTIGTPILIDLNLVREEPDMLTFNKKDIPFGVLLEGAFDSAYKGRIKPFKISNPKEKGTQAKMIVISDGDIVANEVNQGRPIELGVDKWTNFKYGNKELLLNAANYLLDDTGLVNLRSKVVKINFLDKEKAFREARKWQMINIFIPLLLLFGFAFLFNHFRRKKYQ